MTEEKRYAVVIVFSKWGLRKIVTMLENEVGVKDIGVMRIDRSKDGKETNRTIILVKREVWTRSIELNLNRYQKGLDFKISEYKLRDYNFPRKDQSHNFYIPLPKTVSTSYAQQQLENKLEILKDYGVFENIRSRIHIPITTRETEDHKNKAFITFPKHTDLETLALGKVLLHDTRLYCDKTEQESHQLMKCYWARKKKPKRKLTTEINELEITTEDISSD